MRFLADWAVPLHGLLIGLNLVLCVRFALRVRGAAGRLRRADATRAWRPLSFRTASVLISAMVLASAGANDGPAAVAGAGSIALGLALAAPLAGLRPPRRVALALEKTRLAWPAALAGHAVAGAAVAVAHLVISPSPLEGQLVAGGLRWALRDKRWLVATYVFAVSVLVVLPIFLRRVMELAGPRPAAPDVGAGEPHRRLGFGRLAARALGRLALAAVLATWFFGETFVSTRPLLDIHELVHLGSLQAIDQGLLPFIEAQTQYGPGHQLLTYWMMKRIDFSLYGFRMSHLLTNLAAMTLLYFTYLMIFRARMAGCLIGMSLWISPALFIELYGWAVVPRWFGPLFTGLLLPTLFLRQESRSTRRLGSFLLGSLVGLLAWFASENFGGSVVTFVLASVVCWSIRAVGTRALLEIAAGWFLGLASTLAVGFLALFKPGELGRAAELYSRTIGLVTAGISNSGWGHTWDTWAWPYFLTPYLLVAAGLATIYLPELIGVDPRRQEHRIRVVGLLSAAVVLEIVCLFRTDQLHIIGPSMALGALAVLACFWIPELTARRSASRRKVRAALVAGVFLIYPAVDLVKALGKRLRIHRADVEAVVRVLADFAVATPDEAGAGSPDAARRLGWEPPLDEITSYQTWLSFRDWIAMMDSIRDYVGDRKAVVSEFKDIYPSAVYFFADLRVVLAVEPVMSIWTRDEAEWWIASLAKRDVECLITTNQADPVIDSVIASFGEYSIHRVEKPMPYEIYCREGSTGAAGLLGVGGDQVAEVDRQGDAVEAGEAGEPGERRGHPPAVGREARRQVGEPQITALGADADAGETRGLEHPRQGGAAEVVEVHLHEPRPAPAHETRGQAVEVHRVDGDPTAGAQQLPDPAQGRQRLGEMLDDVR